MAIPYSQWSKERKEKHLAKSRAYSKTHKRPGRYHRKYALKRAYGITVEQYDVLYQEQKGLCAICGQPEGQRSLNVDHDHHTGRVRQLLCNCCNAGLGMFKESTRILDSAKHYIERWCSSGQ